jgi:hypothetical protein
MADRAQWLEALRAAHDAGDTERADEIRNRIRTKDAAGGWGEQGPAQQVPVQPEVTKPPLETPPAKTEQELGGRYKITGPLDFSEAQPWERAWAGLGSFPMQLYQSARQLTPGVEDPSRADVKAWRDVAATDEGMAGNIVGSLATPGVGLPMSLSRLAGPVVGRAFPKVAEKLGAPTYAGVENALVSPTIDDESRKWNFLFGYGGQKATQAPGRLLTGVATPTEDATKLMGQGVQPTVGQGSEGFLGRTLGLIEDVVSNIPGVGRGVRAGQQRIDKEVRELAADEARIPGYPVRKVTDPDFVAGLQQDYTDATRNTLSGYGMPVTSMFKSRTTAAGSRELVRVPPEMSREFDKQMDIIMPPTTGRMSAETWNARRQLLREQYEKYALKSNPTEADRSMIRAFMAVDQKMLQWGRQHLPSEVVEGIEDINERMAAGRIVASAEAAKKADPFSGSKALISESRAATPAGSVEIKPSETPAGEWSKGTGRLQEITQPAEQIVGKEQVRDALARRFGYGVAGVVMGAPAAFSGPLGYAALPTMYALAHLGSTKPGAKFLMGGYDWQKKLEKGLRDYVYPVTGRIAGSEAQREKAKE